ncbi:Glycogen synthase [Streptomyces sp. RB5]|uniref:Glycogen synthase n=1 Tax=Streptomyces smaragdinus TaxID=2585196 RepID=A0A7K0CH06_9ACTN|nr:glycosyltransferase family 4 protein [Streptomyces smaragdinus]MQY12761.1 Glycogen synthase [Streptomyces smaragdinus]
MRTILQVTPYYPPHLGGLERVVANLAEGLGARYDVRVVTTALGAHGAARRTREGRVTVRRHRAAELAHTAIAPGLALTLLRAPRGSVLHLHAAHALWPELAALAAKTRRLPLVVHFHLDVDPTGRLGGLLPAYKKHVLGRVLRSAAAVVVLTEAQAEFVRDRYGTPARRVFVVPNGVGAEFYREPREPGPGPLRLLFVGRLSAQKNVARLLDALSLVREPVRLRIVGDGELREELAARVRRLDLGGVVEFSGALYGDELAAAYAAADAFVLPSDKEGMPLAALEAMAAALPVVATDVPGNAELLGDTGLLAGPEPAALAAAIDSLAADPGLRRRLARRSAAAAPGYSWEAVTAAVEQVYAKVAV